MTCLWRRFRSNNCCPGLFFVDEEEVGRDGAAFQVFGGVPGGAVGVVDGDEVDPAEGAYVMHPDVGGSEGVAVGAASQLEGFGDVFWQRSGGEYACFRRNAVDGDLDAVDGRRGGVVEHEVKTLSGTGLSCVASAHDLSCGSTAGGKTYGATCVVGADCVMDDWVRGPVGRGGVFEEGLIARRLGEGEGAGEEEERDGEATHTNLLGSLTRGSHVLKTLLLRGGEIQWRTRGCDCEEPRWRS
jgi:hypothetical protein